MAFRIGSNMGDLHGTSQRLPAVRTYVRGRDGIKTAFVPGMTSAHSPHGEPAASGGAVLLERLEGVGRARRVEAAAGCKVPTDEAPRPNRQCENPRHRTEAVTSSVRPASRRAGHGASGAPRARASASVRAS